MRSASPEPRTTTIRSGAGFYGPGEEIKVDTESVYDLDTGEVLEERTFTDEPGKVQQITEEARVWDATSTEGVQAVDTPADEGYSAVSTTEDEGADTISTPDGTPAPVGWCEARSF